MIEKIKDFFLRILLFFTGPRIVIKRYQMGADLRWYQRRQLQTWQGHKMFGTVISEARQAQKRISRALGKLQGQRGISGRQMVKFRKAMLRQVKAGAS